MGSTKVVVWVADVFTRAVDAPCVRLARKVEGMVFLKEEDTLPVKQ